jgi:PAS domain S-box-containing protein
MQRASMIHAALATMFTLAAALACGKTTEEPKELHAPPPFASFKNVPGVTEEEITAIENLKKEHSTLIFRVALAPEAFLKENGEIGGFSALLCEWLGSLFAVRFQPQAFPQNVMLEKHNVFEIDFVGSHGAAKERLGDYSITGAVAERQYKMLRIKGSSDLSQISRTRPLRYVFLKNSDMAKSVASVTENGTYETVWADDYPDAYRALNSGRADAFIGTNVAETFFDTHDNVYFEDFFPFIFAPLSIATTRAELEPIISVVTKAMQNGAMPYLTHLYSQGNKAYKKNKFFMQLTEEEKMFLRSPSPVPLAVRHFNYPVDFYNAYNGKWEGIAFDVLGEVERLTGLTFKVVSNGQETLSDLFEMIYIGRAHIMPELIYSKSRAEQCIWAGHKFIDDQFALLSKSKYPNVSINEIPYLKVGLIKNTVRAEMYRAWFPGAGNITEFDSDEKALLAMDKGEVDLVMSTKNRLLAILNYYGFSDYKANLLFNYPCESTFGFPKDQTVLCSIVDKAIPFINTAVIAEQWMSKTYDYKTRVMQAQRPWLIGATVLSLVVLALILVLFSKNRNEGRLLEKLVAGQTSTLSAILDSTPDLIFCKDSNSKLTECNKAMENHFNIRKSDILGKNDTEVFGMGLDLASHYKEMDNKILAAGQTVIVEEFIPSHEGELALFESIKSPLIQNNKVIGLVIMSRNITQRKIMEVEALRASKAKSQFIANMSHEIRTPMNAIMGIAEAQLDGHEEELSPNIKEAFGRIYHSGSLLLQIISDLLDLSKIEAGKLDLTPGRYNVASLINDVVQINKLRFDSKPIEFKLYVDANAPASLIGDDLRIKQVLNNLLSNAFKYTQEGEVALTATFGPGEDDSHVTLIFTVSDTGEGISSQNQKHIFAEFTRFSQSANRSTVGTGLGLSITKSLVDMMGGRILLESELGRGSAFTVHLPQMLSGSTAVLGKDVADSLQNQQAANMPHVKKPPVLRDRMPYGSVLIVDDVEMNIFVAKLLMKPYALNVSSAMSGFEAVERIKGHEKFDIIFMDHMMPKMDGIEATKIIRSLGYKAPIVALTANAVVGQADMFLKRGFDDFLSKPIDLRALNAILNKYVRDKHQSTAAEAAQGQEMSGNQKMPSVPGLNIERGLSVFDGDRDDYMSALASFSKNAPQTINNLRCVVNEENISEYAINIHSLKSMCAWICADGLRERAAGLEAMAKAGDLAGLAARNSFFLKDADAFLKALSSMLLEGK